MLWLGIEKKDGAVLYSLGKDSDRKGYVVSPTKNDDDVVAGLTKELQEAEGEIKIRLRADKSLPIETIKSATLGLQTVEVNLNRFREPSKRLADHRARRGERAVQISHPSSPSSPSSPRPLVPSFPRSAWERTASRRSRVAGVACAGTRLIPLDVLAC